MKKLIGIVNCGTGNFLAIKNMLDFLGIDSEVEVNPKNALKFDKIILPGVGSFDDNIQKLYSSGWVEGLELFKEKQRDILGICVGMQIMLNKSEEGNNKGLGWVDGEVKKFDKKLIQNNLPIPHMGWNKIKFNHENKLFVDFKDDTKFYFCHSFYSKIFDNKYSTSTTRYGFDFCSSFQFNNLHAVQFHPEKSHKYGINLLNNFVKN